MKNILLICSMLLSTHSFAQPDQNPAAVVQNAAGFRMIKIDQGSIYEKLGLKEGDIVKKINGSPIASPADAESLFSKLKDSKKTVIVIERNGKEQIIRYTVK